MKNEEAITRIPNLKTFRGSNFYGTATKVSEYGYLKNPQPYINSTPTYTILSYQTPIAWFDTNTGWNMVTSQKFGWTTVKHQNIVKAGLGENTPIIEH